MFRLVFLSETKTKQNKQVASFSSVPRFTCFFPKTVADGVEIHFSIG